MGDELREWCEQHNFDFDQFVSLNITLEKLLSSKSTIVLAEQLGLSTSADRGRLIDGIKELRLKLNEDNNNEEEEEEEEDEIGAYDDPEVIVKDGGDYNEFENEKTEEEEEEQEEKSIHEESFMLRSNFSDAPEDQWDIVNFFDNNENFKKFKPILLLQMQIQNSANYNGNDGMGNQNDQLDHLLDSMLGGPHQNDSSSDSDEDIYNTQQEQDTNTFGEYISMGYMPSPLSLIYDNVLLQYKFNDIENNIRKQEEDGDEKTPFYISIGYSEPLDYQSSKDDSCEHFMTISLENNISNTNNIYSRYKLNIVIVLETSSSMNDIYSNTSKTKQIISNEIISVLFDLLNEDDKFCLVTFNDTFNIEIPLEDIGSILQQNTNIQRDIMNISSSGGGTDFDEGYNAALGQLQELFDVQVMQSSYEDDDNDSDNKQNQIENRIILITNNVPNYDSSLMDLMQVYSDSDENKIYASFINIGDEQPSNKLINNIYKLRGCNIKSYLNHGENIINNIKNDFNNIINPIFFNINLTVKNLKTDTIYGYNNNMKKITKLNGQGTVKNIKTIFGNNNNNNNKSEVITIRLQPPDDYDNDDGNIQFQIELSYENRDGTIGEIKRDIILTRNKENGIIDTNDNTYYDNISIRKRIVLIKYIELLNEWVARDSNSDNTNLNVSDQFKTQFEIFLKYFTHQLDQIKDNTLNQEIDILNNLIQFDPDKAAQLRKSAAQ